MVERAGTGVEQARSRGRRRRTDSWRPDRITQGIRSTESSASGPDHLGEMGDATPGLGPEHANGAADKSALEFDRLQASPKQYLKGSRRWRGLTRTTGEARWREMPEGWPPSVRPGRFRLDQGSQPSLALGKRLAVLSESVTMKRGSHADNLALSSGGSSGPLSQVQERR